MTRVAAHQIFCSPENILKLSVIEQDDNNRITRIFSLHEQPAEPAHTIFVDGIISFFPLSLAGENYRTDQLEQEYLLLDASDILSGEEVKKTDLPLLIDFQTNDVRKINELLTALPDILKGFSVNEIITACTWQPAKVLGLPSELVEGKVFQLANWRITGNNSELPQLQISRI